MKTTVEISDPIIERAKEVAFREKISFRELLQSALINELNSREKTTRRKKLPDRSVGSAKESGCWLDDWEEAKKTIRTPRQSLK